MSRVSSLKIKHTVAGCPLFETLWVVSASLFFQFYVYPMLIVYVIAGFAGLHYYKKRYLTDYTVLRFDIGAPFKSELLVQGLPEKLFEQIDQIILANKLVVITCPEHHFLRMGLRDYVYNKIGFVEFEDGAEIAIHEKELGKRAFLLSYRNKSNLQGTISDLLQRGWKISGEQGMESNLIDRVYTQRMVYEPEVS